MHEPELAAKLRRLMLIGCVLAVAMVVVAFLPGSRVYGSSERVTHAGGLPLVVFALASLAPALLSWRSPRRRGGWIWVAWMPVATAGALMLWLRLEVPADPLVRTQLLWPHFVAGISATGMLSLVLGVVPMTLLATPKPPALPEARATIAP